ncbi:MAG: tyrosine-type recombinase/integrase [Burkholderiales bacterium]|nr:tyrosine-type recombinase/integrase [Burkholderiales bacterium]
MKSSSLTIQNAIHKVDLSSENNAGIGANNDIDAIKIWLKEFIASPNTFISYRQCAERFIMWAIAQRHTLATIKREDIMSYQSFLNDPSPAEIWCGPAVSRQNKNWRPFVKGLSSTSIRLNLQILTTMYEYLIQSGYLSINPFRLIKRKSARLNVTNKKVERYLSHKEWDLICNFINNMPENNQVNKEHKSRVRWIFNLLYLSGCRRSEITNAKMNDFIHKNGQWWLRVIGKGNKYGEIPVTKSLLEELIQYRKSLNLPDLPGVHEHNIAIVNSLRFHSSSLSGISHSMLYKIIKSTCILIAQEVKLDDPGAAYVIEQVSTHWLRHTSATHQVDAGIDIRVVKENLRHSLLETTMKYQHTEDAARHEETSKKFGIK